MKICFSLLILMSMVACSPPAGDGREETTDNASFNTEYARGFKISKVNGHTMVEVTKPFPGATAGFKYLLIPKGSPVPEHNPNIQIVRVPLESIVCTSTTHIPLLDYLNETESLVGFPTTDYISSEKMRKHIESGGVTDLGIDAELNMERLLLLGPEAVMGYSLHGKLGQFRKIREAGIPVIFNAEYLEEHPLGRAEWIKFMALFFGKEKMADSVFNSIKRKYLQLKQYAEQAAVKPQVFSGIVYGNTWFMPGGRNYASKILEDAACNYLWSHTGSTGFLELSFEAVYEKAHRADYWIGVGSFESLQQLRLADERYGGFKAFKTGNVYSYNARMGAEGGSEFLELGYLRPDIILADLIKITHPQLLPDHELYFYFKLE